MYDILAIDPETGEATKVDTFEEAPAPAVTLGGYLLSLTLTSGIEHIAVPHIA